MGKSGKRKRDHKDREEQKLFKKFKKFMKTISSDASDSENSVRASSDRVEDSREDVTSKTTDAGSPAIENDQDTTATNKENNAPAALDAGSVGVLPDNPPLLPPSQDPDPVADLPVQAFDEETLRILGVDLDAEVPDLHFHPSLAANWEKWISEGLGKGEQTDLLAKYSKVGNCRLEAPKLNPEVAASLYETSVKRDKYLANAQNVRGAAMAALGAAITTLLNNRNEGVDQMQLLSYLADAGRLLASAHRLDTISRKAFIVPCLDKKVKLILDGIKTDSFLFGEDLAEKIKAAKTIEKTGSELKAQPSSQKQPLRTSNTGNYKRPPAQNNRGFQGGYSQKNSQKYVKFQKKQSPPKQQPDRQQFRSSSYKQNSQSRR